jgi:hypothetical protein
MSARLAGFVAALALAACTQAPSSSGLPPDHRSSPPASTGPDLLPVTSYAQEFCVDPSTSAACPPGSVPDLLRRPLHLPELDPATTCPVSAPNPQIWSRLAGGLGPGPIGPVGLGPHAILRYRKGGAGWGLQKVLWAASPDYDGPILIRGARIDGEGAVGFNVNGDGAPLAELQLPPGSAPEASHGGWRGWPSYTRVREPGCYAYQVDGTDFSIVIVFRAVPLR